MKQDFEQVHWSKENVFCENLFEFMLRNQNFEKPGEFFIYYRNYFCAHYHRKDDFDLSRYHPE